MITQKILRRLLIFLVYNNHVAYAVNPDRTAVAKVHNVDVSERVEVRQTARLRRHEGIPAGDVLKLRQLHALSDHIEEQQQFNENAGVGIELNELSVVIEMEINYIKDDMDQFTFEQKI